MLCETRQDIARVWQVSDTSQVPSAVLSSRSVTSVVKSPSLRKGQRPLTDDVLELLHTTGQAMTPIEIDKALRANGREMHANAVTSAVAKLVKRRRLVKAPGALYSVPAQPIAVEEPLLEQLPVRPSSIAAQAYVILKQAGRPMTAEEITALLQEEDKSINPRSVATSLYHSAQDGVLFRRLGPKLFGLLDWKQVAEDMDHDEKEAISSEDRSSDQDQKQWRGTSEKENTAPLFFAEDNQLP